MCVSVSIGMLGCSGGDTKSKDNKQESAEEQTPASPADQDTADDNVKQSETGPAEQPKEEMPAGDYKDTGTVPCILPVQTKPPRTARCLSSIPRKALPSL